VPVNNVSTATLYSLIVIVSTLYSKRQPPCLDNLEFKWTILYTKFYENKNINKNKTPARQINISTTGSCSRSANNDVRLNFRILRTASHSTIVVLNS